MGWLRLSLDLEEASVARAEALLESLGALSVALTDAGDQPLLEPGPGEEPLWRECRLQALFDMSLDVAALRRGLAGAGWTAASVDFLDDDDWQNRWRQYAQSFRFGDRLHLVPKDAEVPGEPVLRLDPGLAFGSGSHPTTRLCLEWLAGQDLAGARVLDYGCGSGVLALAALKLGASRALAIDHDPQALLATRENAAYNALADERLDVGPPAALEDALFDVVLANILANPLIELAPRLTGALAPSGVLVLSGMLEDQAAGVVAGYPELSFEEPRMEADEQGARWICLIGRRRADSPLGGGAAWR